MLRKSLQKSDISFDVILCDYESYEERNVSVETGSKWLLTDEEKDRFISALTPNLTVLRTKAEMSQEEFANLIDVSRQAYYSIWPESVLSPPRRGGDNK